MIKVIIIDDVDLYRQSLANWLTLNGIEVQETFTHAWFIHYETLKILPDVAIVSLNNISDAKPAIDFLRKYYPSIKILVNSMHNYLNLTDEKMGLPAVDGLVYKLDDNQYKIIDAIKVLSESKD